MKQLVAAFLRGLLIAFLSAGTAFFTALATTSTRDAFITAGATAFATLLVRVGGEGAYDAYRNGHNLVKPSDVTGSADQLERLAKLRADGTLTDAEFQAEKAKVLGS
jgi:hypothetical protein